MPVWIVLGVCAAVFVMVVAVAGSFNLFNGGMPTARDDRPRRLLPPDFDVGDLDAIAFSPALRGYRMDEVDAVIGEMSARIRLQDALICDLEGESVIPQERPTPPSAEPSALESPETELRP